MAEARLQLQCIMAYSALSNNVAMGYNIMVLPLSYVSYHTLTMYVIIVVLRFSKVWLWGIVPLVWYNGVLRAKPEEFHYTTRRVQTIYDIPYIV